MPDMDPVFVVDDLAEQPLLQHARNVEADLQRSFPAAGGNGCPCRIAQMNGNARAALHSVRHAGCIRFGMADRQRNPRRRDGVHKRLCTVQLRRDHPELQDIPVFAQIAGIFRRVDRADLVERAAVFRVQKRPLKKQSGNIAGCILPHGCAHLFHGVQRALYTDIVIDRA